MFVNGMTASSNELTASVKDGDEISILILLLGGQRFLFQKEE
jgi:hypothetical protein